MRLCGDIGGTKVLLALVDGAGNIRQQCRLASADFASFGDLLGAYLGQIDTAIDGGCLAVAGPVANDGRSAKITNLPWTIDCAALEARFGLGRLALINDFAAQALPLGLPGGPGLMFPGRQRRQNTPGLGDSAGTSSPRPSRTSYPAALA